MISDYEREKQVLGKLWEKSNDRGPYMSGYLQDLETGERTQVVVFHNRKRAGKKDPDWLIHKSRPLKDIPEKPESKSVYEDDSLPF